MSTLPSVSTAASPPAQPGRRSLLKRLSGVLAGSFLASPLHALLGHAPAAAASPLTGGNEPYVGEIILVPYNYAPNGYALCNGQILQINSNPALFSLLGIQFGGNGSTNFALPNLNGRVVVGAGQGPGLSNYPTGQSGGTDTVPLFPNQLPAHQHTMALTYSPEPGTTSSPQGAYLASNGSGQAQYAASGTEFTASGATGPGAPHNNQQPYLNMVYCIALSGIYPSRP